MYTSNRSNFELKKNAFWKICSHQYLLSECEDMDLTVTVLSQPIYIISAKCHIRDIYCSGQLNFFFSFNLEICEIKVLESVHVTFPKFDILKRYCRNTVSLMTFPRLFIEQRLNLSFNI